MRKQIFKLNELTVTPIELSLYVPPIVWKGDSAGHVGINDLFFWVLEGECFLSIDSESYIVRPGQLAYLPKGKMRAYTHVSEHFSMYEMAFSVRANGENLMETLGLCEQNFVVDIKDRAEMTALFENSNLIEFAKNPLHDVGWCANIINIIRIYAKERQKLSGKASEEFKPVLEYMSKNIAEQIKTEDLSALVYMQPTYFIKKFNQNYGLPPMAYLNRMRMYKAMGMLAGTEIPIEQIAKKTGFHDASYFSRAFKKHCKVTPSEYRAEFKGN